MPVHIRHDHKGGFSLIELVASLAIFSIGVLACVELYTVSFRTTSDSLDYTQAVFLAEGLLEETMMGDYLTASTDSGAFGGGYPRHFWELEIEETDQEGLLKIRLVVTWTARDVEKKYELTTLHADRDIFEAPLI